MTNDLKHVTFTTHRSYGPEWLVTSPVRLKKGEHVIGRSKNGHESMLVITGRAMDDLYTFKNVEPTPVPMYTTDKPMTPKEFAARWNSDERGGGITNNDCARCAVAWGLVRHHIDHPVDTIVSMVLDHAGIKKENTMSTDQFTNADLDELAALLPTHFFAMLGARGIVLGSDNVTDALEDLRDLDDKHRPALVVAVPVDGTPARIIAGRTLAEDPVVLATEQQLCENDFRTLPRLEPALSADHLDDPEDSTDMFHITHRNNALRALNNHAKD